MNLKVMKGPSASFKSTKLEKLANNTIVIILLTNYTFNLVEGERGIPDKQEHGLTIKIINASIDTDAIIRSVISGVFTNVAILSTDGTYKSPLTSNSLTLHSSSVISWIKPTYIVFTDT